jgi:CRISPR-associated protein Cas1
MLKRTLVFSNPINLSLKNQQIVIAYKDTPDDKITVPIEDVGVVVLEHQQISITLPLINALTWGLIEKKSKPQPLQLEFF